LAGTAQLKLNDRRPDEGLDLLGYYLAALDTSGNTPGPCIDKLPSSASVTERLDCVLSTYVGRSYEDMLLEFHTMLVLKDYRATDERWRLEWLGDYNDGASGPIFPNAEDPTSPTSKSISQRKPFVGSTATGGVGYPPTPTSQLPDHLYRVRRVQDTYTCPDPSAPCAPGTNLIVNTLTPGATKSARAPGLGKWGSAYVSMHPDPAYGKLEVHAKVESGTPRFRVFTIDPNGVPALLPACNVGKRGSEQCPLSPNKTIDVSVDVTADVDEVLLVASNGNEPASFTWRLGPSTARLTIVSPVTGSPATIGDYGSGTLSRKPFTLIFTATDADDQPVDTVNGGNLIVSVDGTPLNTTGQCGAAGGAGCPFTLLALSGGAYMAVVDVPASLYPASPGLLDLSIASAGLVGDTQADALEVAAAPKPVAQTFVVDTSSSMDNFGKLNAVKKALNLIVDGLSDDDWAGLVIFSTHSLTVEPVGLLGSGNKRQEMADAIESLFAFGSTAIGNGLFRGQDALATAFDGGKVTPAPEPALVLLSDGLSNCDWRPKDYAFTNKTKDAPLLDRSRICTIATVPDSSPWPEDKSSAPYESPTLAFFSRRSAKLTTPRISVIGVGQDADMSTIDFLAGISGGLRFYVPNPSPEDLLTLNIASAFRNATNAASGHQRITGTIATSLKSLPSFSVDSSATELLVSVLSVSAEDPADAVKLLSPSSSTIAPVGASAGRAIFRVAAPQAGIWKFSVSTGAGGSGSDPAVFVEAAVRAGCRLTARADVRGSVLASPTDPDFDDEKWVGRDLLLQAVLRDAGGPLPAAIQAQITRPDRTNESVVLFDDGVHADGEAGDGVFGAAYARTSQEGNYLVRFAASGPGGACVRQHSDTVALRPAPDLDDDGLPDWWQHQFGLRRAARATIRIAMRSATSTSSPRARTRWYRTPTAVASRITRSWWRAGIP
jgi:hypothetical protein